ncbi:flagellar basal body rod protein FlgB [Neobacillus niacini]|uniref:flagellar basal body rod protein FlgB n=1 Tax=Neobacillus niacini TaxID=86668 RepID=UPI00203ED34C|nr:flagellar basal body rod protein FlgB [Neobacillus niacini]MCM3693274.1 flagellar basal body rod protein FlgB [Neobacillus niacini]
MNPIIGVMSRAMDASSLRQNAISNNIANADTPNFKPTHVSFENLLQQEISSTFTGSRTDSKHFTIGRTDQIPIPKSFQDNVLMKNSKNGVDLDYEMTEMSKNALWYQSLTYGINEEFNLLKMSIRGSR